MSSSENRTSYHHGNLANALEEAGIGLARAGGPDAVALREAARRAGVSATAAYRHFAGQQDLLERVKQRALAMLADQMRAALVKVPQVGEPGDIAIARLYAACWAYLGFARDEPGCFATAFRRTKAEAPPDDGGMVGDDAFRLLGSLVDALVDTGRMAEEDRPGADLATWAAVHGVAVLLLDGPLRHLPAAAQNAAAERTLDTIVNGLTRRGRAV
ncbi:TetR/AcrR family transcriptional regulator [Actinacidiphila guanduensis]|uniref:Transcriptional regulator, TetR family n=1 Tax=Actinacidiphila guanduensis TaxID=310781 RepID=A0A1H0S4V8_9ACTN|nr:TetR/AcrR family transcriptional regulator [Actinacidiphila guanduensis]SDP36276.1 transcriptional regulator, TetR family [Actinacidiphila guanduensis]